MLSAVCNSQFIEMFGDPVKNPFGWPTMTLDQATKEIVSGQCLNGDAGKLQPGQKAVLKVSAVTYGSFDANEYKVLRDTKQITKGVYPQKGDLLFSRANTREYVGATVLIDQDYPELMLPDKLWKLIFKHEIMPMFAKQFLSHPEIRKVLSSMATGTSGSMYNISMEKLKRLTFYFLPIRDMGLTDELYIKMNSRGKPLTVFEHFKAELEREIRALDEKNGQNTADRIVGKIDKSWTDLLWKYRSSGSSDADDNIIDDEFLRYFKFVCDIICYRNGQSPQGYSSDVFDLLHLYFSADDEKAVANIATLESFFDCWCKIKGYNNPTEFLESFMSYTHARGKIVVDSRYKIDVFEDCLHFYSDKSGRIRQFPLNRIVLLYAITIYLQHQSEVTYSDFVRRIRIVNNLIQNSEDEVSDRQDRNRIPAILQAVDAIILTGVIDDSIEINFNVNQIQEEKEKIEFLMQNPDRTDEVFELEDHNMLKGQIGIIGLDNLSLGSRFSSLFTCSWDKIDCALMALGNYGQQERNKWRYQFASKSLQYAWDELFHKSANAGFENTHTILVELLKSKESFDDGILDRIISAFLAQCEKDNLYPWNYYYVKYPVFRPGSYGKMSNDDVVNKPYMFSVMQTKTQWSQNTYMPYLKEADDDHLSRDEMGQYLVYDDVYIVCENNSYGVYRNDDDSLTDTVTISQNEAGIDTEDRIIKLKKYIANMK